MKASKKPNRENLVLTAAIALSVIVHGAMIVRGFGEPDAARLVVAAAEWHFTGEPLYQSYIFRTSPLFIHDIKLGLALGVPLAAMPALLNWFAVLAGALTLWPMFLLWKRLSDATVAGAACVLFALTPAYWVANAYGMAHLPAFTCFVTALYVFVSGLTANSLVRLGVGALLAIVGVCLKADIILCYGAFLGAAYCLGRLNRTSVAYAVVVPIAAFAAVTLYARAIAPDLGQLTSVAGAWSEKFPFAAAALTDAENRVILINSMGRLLFLLAPIAIAMGLAGKAFRRQTLFALAWALPPLLFWGLKLGNSARHMMAAVCALTFVIALVGVPRLRTPRMRWAALAGVFVLNYALGPATGDSVSPTPRLHALNADLKTFASKLHNGARGFATLPVPAKMFVGGPGAPYAMFEVMTRSAEVKASRDDREINELAEEWPRYQVTYHNGEKYNIGIMQVRAPFEAPGMEEWFAFSFEQNIVTRNNMATWRPYLNEAVREDPASASDWAINAQFKIDAAVALTEAGRIEEALSFFEGALEDRPNLPDAMWGVAVLSLELGRREAARQAFARFVQVHPRDPRADLARQELGR